MPDKHWISAVPEKSPAVVVPKENTHIPDVLDSDLGPFIDDISLSAIQLLAEVRFISDGEYPLEAILLFPGTSTQIHPVWVLEAPGEIVDRLREEYYRPFEQNRYSFRGQIIHLLHVEDRVLYAAKMNNYVLLSESSLGIEEAIRSYLGVSPSIDFVEADIEPASLILNTPSLDRWAEQLAKVEFRPGLLEAFSGSKPALFKMESGEEESQNLRFTGTVPLDENKSELISAVSSENRAPELDRYISSNAAAFGIFHLEPRKAPPAEMEDMDDGSELDSLLIDNETLYRDLSNTMEREFALVLYAQSGFLNVGEHLFIRKLSDPDGFEQLLGELEDQNAIERRDGAWFLHSRVMGQLIGSQLNSYLDFYMNVIGDAVVISRRKGLVDLVESDHNRRRVMYYENLYSDMREDMPDEISFMFIADTEFEEFVQPYLAPESHFGALASRFDQFNVFGELDEQGENINLYVNTYSREASQQPYEEEWFFSFSNGLTGTPVLADIRGSSRSEVIFATESGEVYALAADGTAVTEVSTEGNDTPVGPPHIYDWYGTGQNVILLAAGNKIYGWDDNGNMLPRFPFELDEEITTPLVVNDINRDGIPEAIVATADRRIHALDGRGNNINGWPVTTNSQINEELLVDQFKGSRSLIAFSGNTVHAWNAEGELHDDFPKFINSSFTTAPMLNDETIYGGASDGHLYLIGDDRTIDDSLNVYESLTDSADIEAAYVADSPLSGTPSFHSNVTVGREGGVEQEGEGETVTEDMILTMSSNGSVFLLNEAGRLRFTRSMGQPVAENFSPFIVDLNGDLQNELVALAGFGRLYAWELGDGERIYSLPTSAMQFPIVADIDGDGNQEIIAQTGGGLRAWTIYPEGD